MISISNKQRIFEISAVLVTGLLKFVFMDLLQAKLVFISLAISFWGAYLWYIQSKNASILAYWGFTKLNLKESFQFLAPLAALSALSFLIVGVWNQQAIFSWHIIPIIFIYPLWGLIQQFLIMSLFAGNLQNQSKFPISKNLIIILTAILFGLVHYPFPLLMIGTSILAFVYTYTYLRFQNLWFLGVFHGILGAFFYYWVLGRDTYLELFSSLT